MGIAAPIILKFDGTVEDKAAVERALTVTTTPRTEGSWAWLGEDNGSRVHWRTKNYYKPGTKVHMSAKLYGLDVPAECQLPPPGTTADEPKAPGEELLIDAGTHAGARA